MKNENLLQLEEFRSFMILKNFSVKTIKTYTQIVHYFLNYCENNYSDMEMSDDLVRKYLLHRFDRKLDWQTVNSDYSAIQKISINSLSFSSTEKK